MFASYCGGDKREHGQGVYDKMGERSYLGKVFLESQQRLPAVIAVLRRQRLQERAFKASLSAEILQDFLKGGLHLT